MTVRMTRQEVAERLRDLPGWEEREGKLFRNFKFDTYMDGIRFVEAVALESEAIDHHPDMLLVRYADVDLLLFTHSTEGITYRDFDLAAAADRAAEPLQKRDP